MTVQNEFIGSRIRLLGTLFLGALLFSCNGMAAESKLEAGQLIALENCAKCHAIGSSDKSPLDEAPPFRRLRDLYPVEDLAEALAEGIVVGHKEMPAFEFDPAQIDALLTYIRSLGSRRR